MLTFLAKLRIKQLKKEHMFSIGTSTYNQTITIPKGVECRERSEEFIDNGKINKINITKIETLENHDSLTYQISIIYRRCTDSQPNWTIQINNQHFANDESLQYLGSEEFVFRPVNKKFLEIQETDGNATQYVWVNLSKKKYEIKYIFPIINEKIQALIEKGKVFQTADGKEVKKIFFSNDVGVLLYTKDKDGETSIYHAKEKEFLRCVSERKRQCRCEAGDSIWEITLPAERNSHTFEFPQGKSNHKAYHGKVLWDNEPLNSIIL
jgi:hypothetical protein